MLLFYLYDLIANNEIRCISLSPEHMLNGSQRINYLKYVKLQIMLGFLELLILMQYCSSENKFKICDFLYEDNEV